MLRPDPSLSALEAPEPTYGLRVVWPILSGLLVLIVGLGVVTGLVEGWSVQESVYFSFVSGLTIGYGDFAPRLCSDAGPRSPTASAASS